MNKVKVRFNKINIIFINIYLFITFVENKLINGKKTSDSMSEL